MCGGGKGGAAKPFFSVTLNKKPYNNHVRIWFKIGGKRAGLGYLGVLGHIFSRFGTFSSLFFDTFLSRFHPSPADNLQEFNGNHLVVLLW